MTIIEFSNINKAYGEDKRVIKEFSLSVEQGEFVTILGPSGCGKTTMLKMVNKLIKPDSGRIFIKGKEINEWDTIELRRSIGYVIQHIGLLPHMTINQNISFVLTLQKKSNNYKDRKAKELIRLVGLDEEILSRYPRELSGGQRQRVGVARALASNPDIILMDEPFGAVDEIARTRLQNELKDLHKSLGKTILFVTHDIEEALKLGTKIIIMNDGIIEQIGTKEELVFNPTSDFIKNFLGIKGFRAVMDENVIKDMYDLVLSNNLKVEELHDKLNNLRNQRYA